MLKLLLATGLAGCGFSGYLLYHDVFVVHEPVVGSALIYGGCMLLVLGTSLGLVRSRSVLGDNFPG
ncbi:MAG: hypothetical protein H0V17_03600 [Deltaproteobacteria bacterium]|nr:hypothetical protein [Deltaproteobacteria bacterium]